MKIRFSIFLKILGVMVFCWGLLSLFAEMKGGEQLSSFGKKMAKQNALVVYDPDPFYNLDQQVSESFAEGLAEQNWLVKVATVAAAEKLEEEFDLYVFCANTYNWAPDWAVWNYIESIGTLADKPAVAITLGSGSTQRSQRVLEEIIVAQKAELIDSESLWLLRPNDESRLHDSNITIAKDQAKEMGIKTARQLTSHSEEK